MSLTDEVFDRCIKRVAVLKKIIALKESVLFDFDEELPSLAYYERVVKAERERRLAEAKQA